MEMFNQPTANMNGYDMLGFFLDIYQGLLDRNAQLQKQLNDTRIGDPNHPLNLVSTLDANQSVPPISSNGMGTAYFTLKNKTLHYDITVSNLTSDIVAAHFHRGAKGTNGPVVQPIIFNLNHAKGDWANLSDSDLNDLMSGNIYVNVHTQQHPDGEIRGQIMQFGM